MHPQRKIQLQKLAIIITIWTILGSFLALYDHLLLASHFSLGPTQDYTFVSSFIFNTVAGFMGGLMGGIFLVFILNRKLRSQPYINGILWVCLSFVVIVSFITVVMAAVQVVVETGSFALTPEAKESFSKLVFTTQHPKNMIFWALIVGLTQMGLHVNDKFGHGLLWSMIRGKYHFPVNEQRIFMFLDLRSSTTIAERLGDHKYHQLLKDLFSDITDPILNNKGEIYQYVGDEVVISWKMQEGVEEYHCVKCFFDVKGKLELLKDKYQQQYQLFPEFKAGIHFGKVIAGEIGIIKRDITYSGDVLNTTARIQSLCNTYGANLLSSKELLDLLDLPEEMKLSPLGAITLRGKEAEVELIGLDEK